MVYNTCHWLSLQVCLGAIFILDIICLGVGGGGG